VESLLTTIRYMEKKQSEDSNKQTREFELLHVVVEQEARKPRYSNALKTTA